MSQKNDLNKNDNEGVEEILVYVDLEPTSMYENQIKQATRLKMIGNEKKVLLQVNNRFFEGKIKKVLAGSYFNRL